MTVEVKEADHNLLQFETYDKYLDSLVTPRDLHYLKSTTISRELARLGHLEGGKPYDEETFYSRRETVKKILYPEHKINILSSALTIPTNDLQRELSNRERPNRIRMLSSIILVCMSSKPGFTISGYIDFAHCLKNEDWKPFFRGKKMLRPRKTDLSYYNSYTGKSIMNETSNYKPFISEHSRLIFLNLHDGKFLHPLSNRNDFKKLRIYTPGYNNIIIYDYVPRERLQYF